MKDQSLFRDERYYAVENASYKIAYMIISYGLLLLIVIRSLLFQQANWDLFVLVIVSSFAATIYQMRNKIINFTWKWLYLMLGSAVLAAIITLVVAYLHNR